MPTPRDVLNEYLWRHEALAELEVYYRHRGAPHDTALVDGTKIKALGRSFIEIKGPIEAETTMIPYHRVLRIERLGKRIWERDPPKTVGDLMDRHQGKNQPDD